MPKKVMARTIREAIQLHMNRIDFYLDSLLRMGADPTRIDHARKLLTDFGHVIDEAIMAIK